MLKIRVIEVEIVTRISLFDNLTEYGSFIMINSLFNNVLSIIQNI